MRTSLPFIHRCTSIVLGTLLVWTPLVVHTSIARADERGTGGASRREAPAAESVPTGDMPSVSRELIDPGGPIGASLGGGSRSATDGIGANADIDRMGAELRADAASELRSAAEGVQAAEATPIALPGGETRTAVGTQAISLPTAEGSVEGMGESFAPVLSSGTATFSVPIAVAPGRAGVQPSLALSYSSAGGNGPVGFGWSLAVPFISRQTDRGLPLYDDRSRWHPNEDRFIYNGGQELVPVEDAAMARVDGHATGGAAAVSAVPADVAGWQQYRARVEGGFMRFFRSPSSTSWVVQAPDGSRFDLGLLPRLEGPSDIDASAALEVDDEDGSRVFRWMITRSSDAHGSTIYYRYARDAGQLYLSDLYYVSPAACAGAASPEGRRACSSTVSSYGARVRLVYEGRDDAFTTYSSGYAVTTARRVRRIEVTAFDDTVGARTLVRRYHLRYDESSFHSLLESVQVEGRPSTAVSVANVPGATLAYEVGLRSVPEGSLGETLVGQLLPAMRFRYSRLPQGEDRIPGFGGLSGRTVDITGPINSIDEARTELFDVNSDGLPDVVVTDPATYRSRDGAPAAGVFFNGFTGDAARPGTAGHFSRAVAVPMPADLSSAMAFSNLNIVPMDIDGDGRQDLLHMPRERSYGWFTPTRAPDAPGAGTVSPSQQGWRFTYARIDLPAGDLDPRIDLGRDGAHIQVLDVNNDHLIDVVRTTGTVMQTWLNLGGLPGGDGRFGSYTITGGSAPTTSTVQLSTAPYDSCLLQSGTPLDFESPEVRLADMNADGLQDIVEVRRGRIRYWPGRGVGSWGVGTRTCSRGGGASRYIEVASPPADLPIDLTGVHLADIDGDGASDILAVRFDAIDVWFNRAGRSFTGRLILRGTPTSASYANRVRLVDIDGSGTLDAVYGSGRDWRYVNFLADAAGVALRPRLLIGVENGLGALTEIDYESAAVDYLRDLAQAESCGDGCESFTWSHAEGAPSARLARLAGGSSAALYRAAGTPVLSTVVRAVRTSDALGVLGREEQVSESRYQYHDGYYEGIEQEFRGFGAADAVVSGAEPSQDMLTRTWFHQGRRPGAIADDRLAWSPDEALKGREYLTEVFDRQGTFVSTSHATLTTRLLATGIDGRPIQYAFVSEMNEVRYGTSPFVASPSDTLSLPSVLREAVSASSGTVSSSGEDAPRVLALRGGSRARLRTTYDSIDNLGHVLEQTAYGHVSIPGWSGPLDEPVTAISQPVILNGGGKWLWRTARGYSYGATSPTLHFGDTTTQFDADTGDATHVSTDVVHPAGTPSYVFGGDPVGQGGALSLTSSADDLQATSWFDAWGNSVAACAGAAVVSGAPTSPPAGCMRFGTVGYDEVYQQFPTSESGWVSALDALTTSVPMAGAPGWDRGLGVIERALDPNGEETRVAYDGLGRMTAMIPPPVAACDTGVPTVVIRYEITADPRTRPISRVLTQSIDRTSACSSLFHYLGGLTVTRGYGYVDGLGRTRATLAQAPDDYGPQRWVRAGIAILDKRGQPLRTYHPVYLADVPDDAGAVLAVGSGTPSLPPFTTAEYDAFGRVTVSVAEDGAPTRTHYHAASSTVCDPLDLEYGTRFTGTCTTTRTDGFGRVIDQILVDSTLPGTADDRYHRLWSYYRADGAVTTLVRAQTTDQNARPSLSSLPSESVRRDFVYDSVARRLGSFDPDTDNPGDGSAATATWRYRFNRVGDFVGVRDPRGCGQNFFYDLGGRLLGEQYVGCAEAPTTANELPVDDVPSGSIGDGVLGASAAVDVRYEFDTLPSWLPMSLSTPNPVSWGQLGRATGVSDRGQRAAVSYDRRGNAIWTARQMALIPARLEIPDDGDPLYDADAPTVTELAPSPGSVSYDEDHTYVESVAYDHANRARVLTYPVDPDFGGAGMTLNARMSINWAGLFNAAWLEIYEGPTLVENTRVVHNSEYDQYGALTAQYRVALFDWYGYDSRRRPSYHLTQRNAAELHGSPGELSRVHAITSEQYTWDRANNLTGITDTRHVGEWPVGHLPREVTMGHDSLYRLTSADMTYTQPNGNSGSDTSGDWRAEASLSNTNDPMRPRPAPRAGGAPANRPEHFDYEWDWLGNHTAWDDDAASFYERSIGTITNGRDLGPGAPEARPSALYLSTNIDTLGGIEDGWDGAGWVSVEYGVSGNVTSFTVHGECTDRVEPSSCADSPSSSVASRVANFQANCSCAVEQHHSLRWDELNRLVEGRRFDRVGGSVGSGSGEWQYVARLRYRYDGANQRTVKESFRADDPNTSHRVGLTVYPGHFERRGLERGLTTYNAQSAGVDATETQYTVAGTRIVWDPEPSAETGEFDRNRRMTVATTDLLGSTAAVVDFASGELLEISTYHPSGARENLWTSDHGAPLEPNGFTGKEADEEIGLTYFGERWLIPRLGRWASPDPLHVHASGGGEALNSYHYVSGNLLQAVDPDGLRVFFVAVRQRDGDGHRVPHPVTAAAARSVGMRDAMRTVRASERGYFTLRRSGELVLTRAGLAADPAEMSEGALRLVRLVRDQQQVVLLAPTRGRSATYRTTIPGTRRSLTVQSSRSGPGSHVGGQTWFSPDAAAAQGRAIAERMNRPDDPVDIDGSAALARNDPAQSTRRPDTTLVFWQTRTDEPRHTEGARNLDHELREHVLPAIGGTHTDRSDRHSPGWEERDDRRLQEMAQEQRSGAQSVPADEARAEP